jgi:hypothetical protein
MFIIDVAYFTNLQHFQSQLHRLRNRINETTQSPTDETRRNSCLWIPRAVDTTTFVGCDSPKLYEESVTSIGAGGAETMSIDRPQTPVDDNRNRMLLYVGDKKTTKMMSTPRLLHTWNGEDMGLCPSGCITVLFIFCRYILSKVISDHICRMQSYLLDVLYSKRQRLTSKSSFHLTNLPIIDDVVLSMMYLLIFTHYRLIKWKKRPFPTY